VKFGVVRHNRRRVRLQADTLAKLASAAPTMVGFKDGLGEEIELMVTIRGKIGDRCLFGRGCHRGGLRRAYKATLGVPVLYRRRMFNFIRKTAMTFIRAVRRRRRGD